MLTRSLSVAGPLSLSSFYEHPKAAVSASSRSICIYHIVIQHIPYPYADAFAWLAERPVIVQIEGDKTKHSKVEIDIPTGVQTEIFILAIHKC